MSRKIYLVSQGCYSDYRIEAVFSNKQDAEDYAKMIGKTGWSGSAEVETYDLDPVGPVERFRKGYRLYDVDVGPRGGVTSGLASYDWDEQQYVRQQTFNHKPGVYYRGKVWSKSEEHATQTVLDLIRTMKATGQTEVKL